MQARPDRLEDCPTSSGEVQSVEERSLRDLNTGLILRRDEGYPSYPKGPWMRRAKSVI